MGKRSHFERREADFYPTPRAAVLPLIPHLHGIRTFAEPCCGAGDLVRHLEGFGLRCVYQGDIRTGQDAFARDSYGEVPVITNPPYDTENHRKLMHALILHFMRAAPFVWLLIGYDWAATKQAAPFLPSCSDIVPIGRVKWIEGSKYTGKDNHAWYRFDARHKGVTVIHRRNNSEVIPRRTSVCQQCRKPYQPQRSSSRFCSETCRQRAHRKRLSVTSVTAAPTPSTVIEPSDSAYEYRYVKHSDMPRLEADGWQRLPALDGTHHGQYASLMRRRVEQDDDLAQSLIG